MSDPRNILYFLLGIIAVAFVVLGYNFYHAQRKTEGVQFNSGPTTSDRAD